MQSLHMGFLLTPSECKSSRGINQVNVFLLSKPAKSVNSNHTQSAPFLIYFFTLWFNENDYEQRDNINVKTTLD